MGKHLYLVGEPKQSFFMSIEQHKIEEKLIGTWINIDSQYWWQFHDKNGEDEKLLTVISNKTVNSVAPAWNFPYAVKADANTIILLMWHQRGVSLCQMKFVGDNLLELQNPPVDNEGNVQMVSITLHKAVS